MHLPRQAETSLNLTTGSPLRDPLRSRLHNNLERRISPNKWATRWVCFVEVQLHQAHLRTPYIHTLYSPEVFIHPTPCILFHFWGNKNIYGLRTTRITDYIKGEDGMAIWLGRSPRPQDLAHAPHAMQWVKTGAPTQFANDMPLRYVSGPLLFFFFSHCFFVLSVPLC